MIACNQLCTCEGRGKIKREEMSVERGAGEKGGGVERESESLEVE
jgi:hypothetical protein